MIEITALVKAFGPRTVLDGLHLTLAPGRVTAVVGPNGAGKSTLMKCLLGLTRPDGGAIRVDGEPLDGTAAYRRDLGYMPQYAAFPENLTAREVLNFVDDLRGNPADRDEELLDGFALDAELDKPLHTLSGGTRQKVSAVLAFRYRPRLLILDEPTAGLDPIAAGLLKDKLLRARHAGATVLLTTHVMSEVEEMADHLVYLIEGRIGFEGAPEALKSEARAATLERALAHRLARRRPPAASAPVVSPSVSAMPAVPAVVPIRVRR